MDRDRFQVIEGAPSEALDRILAMHASYYAREHGMGEVFERKVAEGLAAFLPRLRHPQNRLWLVTAGGQGGRIVGSIAIDGEDLGDGRAHLRWFILEEGCRGLGLGSLLLRQAVRFVDQCGFERAVLWTFKGLDAARHLYEGEGFRLVDEYAGAQWGVRLLEQRFERARAGGGTTVPGSPA